MHYKGCANTSTEGIREEPMSRTESAIRAAMPIGKNQVRVADPHTPQSTYATVDNSMHLVRLAGYHLPHTSYQTPTTKRTSGWALPDLAVKCRTLLLSRIWMLSAREGSVRAAWMQKWKLSYTLANSPHGDRIPTKIAYVRHYAIDMAYINTSGNTA